MSVIDTLLSDIDAAIRGKGERRRHALLRRTTAALLDQLADLSDHHLAIFDDVMLSLARDVDTETRAELAERLADLHRAPKKTLHALALDPSLTVARPIITRSPSLDDDILLTLIGKKTEDVLRLLVERRTLSDVVCDALIEHADDQILFAMARNESIFLSDNALRRLSERALHYQPLYRILRTRPDLSLRHVGAMIEAARQRSNLEFLKADDDHLSYALAMDYAARVAKDSALAFAGESLADDRHDKSDNQNDVAFINLMKDDKIDDALIILAQRCGLSSDSIKRIFNAPHHEPLFFLLRAQDLPWETAKRFMLHKHGALSSAFESELSKAYLALASDTAKRIASFMVSDKTRTPSYQSDQDMLSRSA